MIKKRLVSSCYLFFKSRRGVTSGTLPLDLFNMKEEAKLIWMVYTRVLLLKKKKYAAVKVLDGPQDKVIESKGLDMVRRDWSSLSKELGFLPK